MYLRLMLFFRWLLCFGVLASLSASSADELQRTSVPKPLLTVHFIPFNAETFVGITPSTIKNEQPLTFNSPKIVAEITGWLATNAGSGQFRPGSTRLLAVFADGRPNVLVDQFGDVLTGTSQYKLPTASRQHLDTLLSRMREDRRIAEGQKIEDARPALIRAVKKNDFAAVKRLLEDKADPNVRDNDNETALMNAGFSGSVRLCRLLVEHGANINAEGAKHETALSDAIVGEHFEAFLWFLTHGANVKGNVGATAFDDAVNALDDNLGNRMANVLLAHHAPVEVTDGLQEHTPLMCVIGSQNSVLAAKIIRHGGNINAIDSFDSTPLDWAAVTGNNPAIRLLIAHGAPLNRRMHDGTTALTRAVTGEHLNTVRLLLSYGAVRDVQALKEAALLRDHAILKLLETCRRPERHDAVMVHHL